MRWKTAPNWSSLLGCSCSVVPWTRVNQHNYLETEGMRYTERGGKWWRGERIQLGKHAGSRAKWSSSDISLLLFLLRTIPRYKMHSCRENKREVKRVDPDCSKCHHIHIYVCVWYKDAFLCVSSLFWFAKHLCADLPAQTGLMPSERTVVLGVSGQILTDIKSDVSICLFCNQAVYRPFCKFLWIFKWAWNHFIWPHKD